MHPIAHETQIIAGSARGNPEARPILRRALGELGPIRLPDSLPTRLAVGAVFAAALLYVALVAAEIVLDL